MNKLLITLTLLLCPLFAQASSLKADEIEEKLDDNIKILNVNKIPDVDEVFPLRENYYTKEELLAGFKSVVHEDLWDDFEGGWSAIYDLHVATVNLGKPARRLSVEKEIGHIHCLYKRLSKANPTDEEYQEMQKINIYSSFINDTHIALIEAKDPNLAERIRLFMDS